MIKYQFAYNSLNRITNVSQLDRETLDSIEKYYCISCNSELIPKLGEKRKKHFAHKQERSCAGETYLHNLAKNLFFHEFLKCKKEKIPFYLELFQPRTCTGLFSEFGITCNLGIKLTKFDITKFYSDALLETKQETFIPDVTLIPKKGNDQLFIEFAVTHFIEQKKTNSGFRIIEMNISNEDDLSMISNHCITEDNPNAKFINFKVKREIGDFCSKKCQLKHDLFIVYKYGKCQLFEKTLNEIRAFLMDEKENIVTYNISIDRMGLASKFRYMMAKVHEQKFEIKNCFICRYHAINENFDTENTPIFCKYLKTKSSSYKALKCEYYRIENKYVKEYINTGEEIYKLINEREFSDDNSRIDLII